MIGALREIMGICNPDISSERDKGYPIWMILYPIVTGIICYLYYR